MSYALPVTLRRLSWLVLLLFLGIEIYASVKTRIFSEDIWSPVGFTRLLQFAAFYIVVAGILLLWRPRLCIPVLLTAVVSWTIAASGLVPLAAICLFLFASWNLGRIILEPVNADAIEEVLALLLGLGMYSFVQGLLVHFPINSALSVLTLCALPMLGWPAKTVASLIQLRTLLSNLPTPQISRQRAAAWIGLPLLPHWLVSLIPDAGTDSLAMHLAIPSFVQNHHYWAFDAQRVLWAVMPMGGDWCYTSVFLLAGEPAAHLLNFALLALIAALVFLTLDAVSGRAAATVFTAVFVSTPLVYALTGLLFVENFWAAMIVGAFVALWRFCEHEDRRMLSLAGMLAGIAISAKVLAVAFAIPLVVLACWTARRSSPSRILVFLGLIAAFGAQPYVIAFVKTGNPVFPFLNNIFRSTLLSSTWTLRDVRFERPITLKFLYDATFRTNEFYEGLPGAIGFQYLLLIPVSLFVLRRKTGRLAWMGIICGLTGALLVLLEQSNLRYVYPAMPLLTVGSAAALTSRREDNRTLFRLVSVASVAIVFLNLYFLAAAAPVYRDFWLNPLSNEETASYVERYAPVRNLIDYVNRIAPGEPVIFVGTNHIAGLKGTAYTDTWHNLPVAERLETATSVPLVLAIANDLHVQYFISPRPETNSIMLPAFAPFLAALTDPVYASGPFSLAKLKPNANEIKVDFPPSTQAEGKPAGLFSAGDYDDLDERLTYSGVWVHTREYPQSFDSSISYSNVIGAKVEFSFTGTQMTYVYTRAFNRGRAGVRIDGGVETVIDQYVPQIQWQQERTWRGLPPGPHKVQIRVIPEKTPESEGLYIEVDAIRIR